MEFIFKLFHCFYYVIGNIKAYFQLKNFMDGAHFLLRRIVAIRRNKQLNWRLPSQRSYADRRIRRGR